MRRNRTPCLGSPQATLYPYGQGGKHWLTPAFLVRLSKSGVPRHSRSRKTTPDPLEHPGEKPLRLDQRVKPSNRRPSER